MILPVLQLEVSTVLWFVDRLLFAGKPTNINGGAVWERQLIHHSGLGWQRDPPKQT